MEIKVENFTINLHRAKNAPHEDDIKRLANYVYTLFELEQQAKKQNQKVADNLGNPEKGENK